MAKTPRLSKSGIEYLDYQWSFYSGCHHQEQGVCPPIPCWARTMTERFRNHYPNGFEPTFYPESFLSPLALKKPSRIGVCFMGDLFGDWVEEKIDVKQTVTYSSRAEHRTWNIGPGIITVSGAITALARRLPQHTFVFLTKNPFGMKVWSPFPNNCEVGFSATNPGEFIERVEVIAAVEARVKWCSLEPLLRWDVNFKTDTWRMLDWTAIGAVTGTKADILALAPQYPELTLFQIKGAHWGLMPPIAWIKSIVEQLDACGTKVFIKDNLHEWLYANKYYEPIFIQRQEYGAREGRHSMIYRLLDEKIKDWWVNTFGNTYLTDEMLHLIHVYLDAQIADLFSKVPTPEGLKEELLKLARMTFNGSCCLDVKDCIHPSDNCGECYRDKLMELFQRYTLPLVEQARKEERDIALGIMRTGSRMCSDCREDLLGAYHKIYGDYPEGRQ